MRDRLLSDPGVREERGPNQPHRLARCLGVMGGRLRHHLQQLRAADCVKSVHLELGRVVHGGPSFGNKPPST